MPIWSQILKEIIDTDPPNVDGVRRRYLHNLNKHTGRNVILYASGWLQKSEASPAVATIVDEDVQALMEVVHGLHGDELDLILHSPGGSAAVAEAIVVYLRSRFSHIRVIVPQLAMSAATMIACAADEIVLGKHSFLGPIDPQFVLHTAVGQRAVPAQAILDQFDKAQRECADPAKISVWMPMLTQYGPDLLVQCESALDLSKKMVTTWLEAFMFKDVQNSEERAKKAQSVSDWLADHQQFKSHSRHIPRSDIEAHGLKVSKLEDNQVFQDLVLSVFHSVTHTFGSTGAIKIVENQAGRAFIKGAPV